MNEQQRDLFVTGRRMNGRSQRTSSSVNNELLEQVVSHLGHLTEQVEKLETVVGELRELTVTQKTVKDSYTTEEVATILGNSPYTVREWCRLKRVKAYKAASGRGPEKGWRISHEELLRIQSEGILKQPDQY